MREPGRDAPRPVAVELHIPPAAGLPACGREHPILRDGQIAGGVAAPNPVVIGRVAPEASERNRVVRDQRGIEW